MNYGRYEIVSELGRGAMGMVFKAHDPQIDRMVALKVLREDRLTTEDYVQRFLKEATAIGRLSHPGIVTVYDVGQDHGTIYIAMEFLEGQSMDKLVKEGNLTLKTIVDIGIQIAKALHYAHERGIVHRDIKPQNIIYTPEIAIKVTDFGIAHIDDPDGQQMTRAGEILGTPVYMAPEQVLGQVVDGRSDLYSLGVILYELTTGRRPFQGDNLTAIFRAITTDNAIPPNQLNPDVPASFSDIILKAMSKKPEDRYSSGHEMAELLSTCLDMKSQESFTETVIQQKTTEKKSNAGLIVTTLLLLCGTGLAAYFFLLPPKTEDPQPDKSIPIVEQSQATIQTNEEQAVVIEAIPPASELKDTTEVISISAESTKIKLELPREQDSLPISPPPVRVKPLPQPDEEPIIVIKPDETPVIDKKQLPPEQSDDSFDDLFKEDKANISISTPSNTAEPAPAPEQTGKPETAAIEPAPVPVKTDKAIIPSTVLKPEKDVIKKTAILAINSRPSGARLYIDGDYQGITPIEVETTAMKHEVKLELQGHLGWQAQLNLSKGGKVPLSIPLLTE